MANPRADKLTPTDSRVQHRTFTVPNSPNNKTYHYLLAEPPSATKPVATALLVHGFPDLAFGWRYQVPYLVSLGLRVIVPDLVGFGRSDAPAELAAYSFKTVVDDLAALVRHVQAGAREEGERIVLGGHDWGGAVAWRFALWRPEMLRCVFSVCTPFWAPSDVYLSKAEVVKRLPNFGYQAQFDGTEVEEAVVGRDKIRAFLSVMYGARRADGESVFDVYKGLKRDKLEVGKIGESPLLSREEIDFYADEYVKNGMRGPLCWYKTGRVNFDEEIKLLDQGKTKVTVPALMVVASKDAALPPAMSEGMERHFEKGLVKKQVDATHWALWEAPTETNKYIGEFLEGVLKGQPLKASI
ncbi:hypothetical protein NEMBOFW57_000600 [Staphylotrichum longicolle]|uniref:AB hydrolase-1 domain-containing protein n=1 Tax=Staphylotrichum longicolle TaxID=669026 RepID=A0AAD4I022_9PEZI|nr:hypothetical protein NEMBOFW57_000600 [Staphylotrichum longicolle]